MPITHAAKPPRQDRSRKTRNALLDAAEKLLRDRPWEDISIVEITQTAGCSNGAIYGRFKGKDELLVALYERHDAKLKARFERQQARATPDGETAEEFLTREIDQLIQSMREDRWLLRAMGLLSRSKPNVVSHATREERRGMFEQIGARVLRFQSDFRHPAPERGAQLAVFFVATMVREAILYSGPHADTLDLDDRELRDSLVRMALGFLGVQKNRQE